TAPLLIHTLSLHDALPICCVYELRKQFVWSHSNRCLIYSEHTAKLEPVLCNSAVHIFFVYVSFHVDRAAKSISQSRFQKDPNQRSEEHTSELQSRFDLVCL